MPSSPKLKTESTISCASLAISSTPLTASFLYSASFALSCCCAATGAVLRANAIATATKAITRFILVPFIAWLAQAVAKAASLRDRPHRPVIDAQLVEIRLVLGRIVVILPHFLAVLVEDCLVEMDRRRGFLGDEQDVLQGLH